MSMDFASWLAGHTGESIIVCFRVRPQAGRASIHTWDGACWKVDLKSAPEDNKANEELVRLVAKEGGVSRSSVAVRSGLKARRKVLEIIL